MVCKNLSAFACSKKTSTYNFLSLGLLHLRFAMTIIQWTFVYLDEASSLSNIPMRAE